MIIRAEPLTVAPIDYQLGNRVRIIVRHNEMRVAANATRARRCRIFWSLSSTIWRLVEDSAAYVLISFQTPKINQTGASARRQCVEGSACSSRTL